MITEERPVWSEMIAFPPEATVVLFEGRPGSGKTLSALAFAMEESNRSGKTVISNARLNFDHIHFDPPAIGLNLEIFDCENSILLLDMADLYIANRFSNVEALILFMRLSKIRRNYVLLTASFLDSLDRRLRMFVDYIYTCSCELDAIHGDRVLRLMGRDRSGRNNASINLHGSAVSYYFDFYDTLSISSFGFRTINEWNVPEHNMRVCSCDECSVCTGVCPK